MNRFGTVVVVAALAILFRAAILYAAEPAPSAAPSHAAPSSVPSQAAPPPNAQLVPSLKGSSEPPSKLTPSQREFVESFVKAVNSRDRQAVEKLIAPKCMACFNKDNQFYLDKWTEKQARFLIHGDYTASFSPNDAKSPRTTPLANFPFPPTHSLEIKYGATRELSVTLVRQVAEQHGKWYLVAPCPTAEGLARVKKFETARAERAQRAQALYDKLQDPLLTELRTLIKQKKYGEAVKLCATQLKLDAPTARTLIGIMVKQEKG